MSASSQGSRQFKCSNILLEVYRGEYVCNKCLTVFIKLS